MLDLILAFVEQRCAAPANRFGPEFLTEHLLVVEHYALELAAVLDADRTVVRVAALLHDIAAIENADLMSVHAERGAERVLDLCGRTGRLGDALRLDRSALERVATCVREHSSPKRADETIPESVCVSNADAMSQIARPLYWFHFARACRGLTHADAIEWYAGLVERNWTGMIDVARCAVAAEYAAVASLLRHGAPAVAAGSPR